MKRELCRTLLLAVALATAATALAQEREERFSRTLDIGTAGELSLSNISGDIEVEGTSGGEVRIEAVKRVHGGADRDLLDAVRIEISQTGDRVRIETHYPRRDHDRHGGVSVDYLVTLPAGTEIDIASVSGDLTVRGVEGESSVQTVSGEVTVRDVSYLASAKSVSGDVEVENARSEDEIEIESVSGDVDVVNLEADELSISSVSGDVILDGVFCVNGDFESVSGDIRYRGRIAPGGRYDLKSHSGDVVLRIGSDVGFELEASTFSGDIETEFPMEVRSTGRKGRKIEGVVGDGSAAIDATTFSGDILIRER